MRAEIVAIGTELLLGQIVDTNAAYLARRLAELGVDTFYRQTVGDNHRRCVLALATALERADLVIATGGLGPTEDDITRQAIAAALGVPLVESADALAQVQAYFARIGRPFTDRQRRQALIPEGARLVENPVGSAPGFAWQGGGRVVVAFPGVPRELEAMTERWLIPFLRGYPGPDGEATPLAPEAPRPGVIHSRILRFTGIGEAALEEALEDLIHGRSQPTLATYAGTGEVALRLTAKAADTAAARAVIAPVEAEVLRRVGRYAYGADQDTLESVVAATLMRQGRTLAVAESCTGGLIAHRLTDVPGVSKVLMEAVVAYSNAAKVARLGVDPAVLAEQGAVSEACARAMAEGVRRSAGTDLGLGVTGIAGPEGGTPQKPVGLVYMAASDGQTTAAETHQFPGDRRTVKARAAQAALDLLRRFMLGLPS